MIKVPARVILIVKNANVAERTLDEVLSDRSPTVVEFQTDKGDAKLKQTYKKHKTRNHKNHFMLHVTRVNTDRNKIHFFISGGNC